MREIKFRIYNKENKEMFYPSQDDSQLIFGMEGEGWNLWGECGEFCSSKDDTVIQQYSGLKDKNGKEIYDGDIIRFNSIKNRNTFEVVYGRCSFEFIRETGSRYRADQLMFSDVEVVSNIFETGKSRKLDILYREQDGGNSNLPF